MLLNKYTSSSKFYHMSSKSPDMLTKFYHVSSILVNKTSLTTGLSAMKNAWLTSTSEMLSMTHDMFLTTHDMYFTTYHMFLTANDM